MNQTNKTHIFVPQQLLELEQFKSANKTMKDNMAVFCWVVANEGDLTPFRDNMWYTFASYKRIAQYVREKTITQIRSRLKDIVQCDGIYSSRIQGKEKPLGYRFSKKICEEDFTSYELQSKCLIKKFTSKPAVRVSPPQKCTTSQVDYSFLTPAQRHLVSKVKEFKLLRGNVEVVLPTIHPDQRDRALKQAERFGQWPYVRASRTVTDRLHTPITQLKSELRGALTVRQRPVVRFDVTACQPVIFTAVLRQRSEDGEIDESELARYQREVESGQFYESLVAAVGSDRKKVKKAFCSFLGSPWFEVAPYRLLNWKNIKPTYKHDLEMVRLVGNWFKKEFPTISSFLKKHKTDSRYVSELQEERSKRGAQWRVCSSGSIIMHWLQALESQIIIEECCGTLMKYFPSMVVATVHDELIVSESDQEIALLVLSAAFLKFNICPQISIKALNLK